MADHPTTTILVNPNREVRVIPRGWQHPVDVRGGLQPLLPADDVGDGNTQSRRMPDARHLPAHETDIVAYETASEGTPISPPFPNDAAGRRDLVRFCASHCTTFAKLTAGAEAWAAILFGDATVDVDGTVRAS